MIGSSGCPPLLRSCRGVGPAGEPAPRGHPLGLSSAQSRPSRPRFAGGFRGISFRSRGAKHQENPRASNEGCMHPKRDSIAVLMRANCQSLLQGTSGFRKILDKSYKPTTWDVTKAAFLPIGTQVSTDGSMFLTCCRRQEVLAPILLLRASKPCLKRHSPPGRDVLGEHP
jgi:hypothetical protein